MTKLRLNILRGARTGTIKKAADAYKLQEKWSTQTAALKMSRFARRTQTTDLERFRIMILRKQRAYTARKVAYKALGGKGEKKAKAQKAGKAAPAKGGDKKAAKGKK